MIEQMINFYSSMIFLVYILSGSLLNIPSQAEPLKGVNVERVKEGEYSYVVSIGYRNDQVHEEEAHFCTGVLITKMFVLSAAHCFDEKLLGEIRIIVGSADLRKGKKYYPSMWITYNQWAENKNISSNNADNDIAIIKLSDKVKNGIAKPASLSSKKSEDLYGKHLVLVGYGYSNESPERATRYLHKVEVKVLSNAACETIYFDLLKKKTSIHVKYLCTKAEPHALLDHGDSGGPVLWKNSVTGISKAACPKTGLCNLPQEILNNRQLNVHTGTDLYRAFIDDVLKSY